MEEIWYDGVDRDCDGWSDDDADRDGHDLDTRGGDDCDDDRDDVNPDADEHCNRIDDDCDTEVDEDSAIDAPTWHEDADGDTWGLDGTGVTSCVGPDGTVDRAGDCDDDDPLENPGEVEICGDGLDNDCDGSPSSCGLASVADLGDADHVLRGTSRDDDAGDWDGDGSQDLLIGAPGAGSTGEAYAVLGPITSGGLLPAVATTLASGPAGDTFAYAVSSAGDIDGDGLEDLAIGDYLDASGGREAGLVSILLGSDLPTSGTAPSASYLYEAEGPAARAGNCLAMPGDVDGDGTDDLLVGAYKARGDTSASGAAYLVTRHSPGRDTLGNVGSKLRGESVSDSAGYAVAAPGDVDGDGLGDLLISAPGADSGGGSSGTVYLVLGGFANAIVSLSSADATLIGDSGDSAGTALDSAGDQDGDGLPDLLIAATAYNEGGSFTGATYVVSGLVSGPNALASADATLTGEGGGDHSGVAVADLGDTNGDGWDDLMIGAYGTDDNGTDSGNAYFVLGPVSGTLGLENADGIWSGEGPSVYAGSSLGAPGDLDGDGFDDALVGAYLDETIAEDAGAVYLLLGGEM